VEGKLTVNEIFIYPSLMIVRLLKISVSIHKISVSQKRSIFINDFSKSV